MPHLDLITIFSGVEVEMPAAKKVHFEPTQKSEKLDRSNMRKLQKVQKQKMKRNDKFASKLSDHLEKALENFWQR